MRRYSLKRECFLEKAAISAKLSKDTRGVGAVIVASDGEELSSGYNGPPSGFDDSIIPMSKEKVGLSFNATLSDREYDYIRDDTIHYKSNKYAWTRHAERNAIRFALRGKHSEKLVGSFLFCTRFPCVNCALDIAEEQIAEVHVPWDLTYDNDGNYYCIGAGSTSGMTTEPINEAVAILLSRKVKCVFANMILEER